MSTPVTTVEALPVSAPVATRVRGRALWQRRLRALGASRPAAIGLSIILAWVVLAVLAPLVAPYRPNANDLAAPAPTTPPQAHWLGTDPLGGHPLSPIPCGPRP